MANGMTRLALANIQNKGKKGNEELNEEMGIISSNPKKGMKVVKSKKVKK